MKLRSQWEFYSPYDPVVINNMLQELQIPRSVARILFNRGLHGVDKVRKFVIPSTKNLHDPFRMMDMDKAVQRLTVALRERENILIHGDYDVDGITSVSMLYLFLKDLGGEVSYYIPERALEGYGLSIVGIEEAKARGVSLIVSVDCGITSVQEVEKAREFGIDVIVSDHHEPGTEIPNALAVLDPKRPGCDYPFKDLAGCGVAYKLAQGLVNKLGLEPDYCERYLDLVAIGTAADIVPLVDENRVFVKVGLDKLNEDGLEGIITLCETAGLRIGQIDVGHIVFGIAPRINAVGRLGNASPAVELLVTRNHHRAIQIAQQLETENRRRKEIDSQTLDEALSEIPEMFADKDAAIVLAKENWHPGVIGIVASRLVEKYYRPTVMISIEDSIGKGSARSIPTFDLHNALKSCSDLLLQFGGHKYAAGLTIDQEKIPEFRAKFNEVARNTLTEDDLVPKVFIDDELDFSDVNHKLIDMLQKLAPFGPHNNRPIFMSQGLRVIGEPKIVGKDHLKFRVKQNGVVLDAIAFGRGCDLPILQNNSTIDIVYCLEENTWMNQTTIQLKVKDIH